MAGPSISASIQYKIKMKYPNPIELVYDTTWYALFRKVSKKEPARLTTNT